MVSSTLYGGFSYASSYKKRRKKLEIVILLFERIKEEIRFNSDTLDKILQKLSENEPFNKLQFIKRVKAREIPRIDIKSTEGITDSDEQYIKGLFASLGSSDIECDLKICEKYITLLNNNYEEARKTEGEKTRLVRVLTLISSLAIVVIII